MFVRPNAHPRLVIRLHADPCDSPPPPLRNTREIVQRRAVRPPRSLCQGSLGGSSPWASVSRPLLQESDRPPRQYRTLQQACRDQPADAKAAPCTALGMKRLKEICVVPHDNSSMAHTTTTRLPTQSNGRMKTPIAGRTMQRMFPSSERRCSLRARRALHPQSRHSTLKKDRVFLTKRCSSPSPLSRGAPEGPFEVGLYLRVGRPSSVSFERTIHVR